MQHGHCEKKGCCNLLPPAGRRRYCSEEHKREEQNRARRQRDMVLRDLGLTKTRYGWE